MAEVAAAPAAASVPSSQPDVSAQPPSQAQPNTPGQTPSQAQPNQPPTQAEKKDLPRSKRLKVKVDGREYDEEINFDDDEYLTRQIQLAKVAQKRMGEYTLLERQVKAFIDELKKDPAKVLADPNIGVDVKQLAAKVIEKEIENSKKSPEQLAKEELENKLRTLEEERKREKQDFQQKEFERLQQQAYERYDVQMSKALEKTDLPKSPYIIKKMADYMLIGLQNNLDVTPEDVLPLVREEMQSDLREMFAVMPDEVIERIVGKDVLNRIRKKNIAKAKTQPPAPVSSTKDVGNSGKTSDKGPNVKKQSFRDFFGI